VNVVRLDDNPNQIQIWCYCPPAPQSVADLYRFLVAYGIAALEGWSHMSIRMDNIVWSAEPQGFIPLNAIAEARYPGEIRVFTWEPPLSEREHDAARQALVDMEGAWYDFPLFAQRLAVHVAKFVSYFLKNPILDLVTTILPIDVTGARCVVCYESAARVINAVGRQKVNPATFGPKDLLEGSLACLGVLEKAA
jgi:hypothetical protein